MNDIERLIAGECSKYLPYLTYIGIDRFVKSVDTY